MRIKITFSMLVVLLFCFQSLAEAQGRRGGRGISRTALAMVEQVQDELEVTDEQKTELGEMPGAQRSRRGGERGQRGEGRGEGREKGKRGEGREKGERGERGGRGERGARGEGRGEGRGGRGRGARTVEQVQEEIDALAEVLLPHQMTRLNEIYVQVMGAGAINDPVIAEELKISDDQKDEMQEVQDGLREKMRDLMEESGGDREAMREKMTEMRESINEDVMAVLTDDQKESLDKMKGDEFELPEDALPQRRGRGRGNRQRSDF